MSFANKKVQLVIIQAILDAIKTLWRVVARFTPGEVVKCGFTWQIQLARVAQGQRAAVAVAIAVLEDVGMQAGAGLQPHHQPQVRQVHPRRHLAAFVSGLRRWGIKEKKDRERRLGTPLPTRTCLYTDCNLSIKFL